MKITITNTSSLNVVSTSLGSIGPLQTVVFDNISPSALYDVSYELVMLESKGFITFSVANAAASTKTEILLKSQLPEPPKKFGTRRTYVAGPYSSGSYYAGGDLVGAGSSSPFTGDPKYKMNIYTTNATIDAEAGVSIGARTRIGARPIINMVMRTDSVLTSQRIYCGLARLFNPGNIMSTDNPSTEGFTTAIFRYSTTAGDTTWKAITGQNQIVIDTGVSVAASTTYIFEIDATTAGTIVFKINDAIVATHTTPDISQVDDLAELVYIRTLVAASRSIVVGGIMLEQN